MSYLNRGRPAYEQVRPYNFLLAAHTAKLGHPADADPERLQLIAPYNPDPRQWRKLRWVDTHSDKGFKITTGEGSEYSDRGTVQVRSYADVLADYRTHPEPKSLGPDGRPCDRATVGLMSRRAIHVATITYIGKESNKFEEVQAGFIHDLEDVLNEYSDPELDPFKRLVVPTLRRLAVAQVARETGLSERTVKRIRANATAPRRNNRARLTDYAVRHARTRLRRAGREDPLDDSVTLTSYLVHLTD
jgi:hypothetical protein